MIERLFRKIETLFQNGQLAEAEDICKQAIKLNSQHPVAHRNLGVVLMEAGDSSGALGAFDQALDLAPGYLDVYYPRAIVLKDLGRLPEALESCNQAIRIDPLFALAHNYRGLILNQLGRRKEAMKACDQALMLSPKLPQAHNSRGAILKEMGRFDEALSCYDRALELDPGNADVHYNRAVLLKDTGKLPDACTSFRSALEINPDMTKAKYFLASIEGMDQPQSSPETYVKGLFDAYADRFDDDLVNNLKYTGPKLICDAVNNRLPDRPVKPIRILDLGCGTGLCGELFFNQASRLVGVDISSQMIVNAEAKGIYSELIQSDLSSFLDQTTDQFDLVISADVFVYIGKLDNIFSEISKRLDSGGLFAFTIETGESTEDYQLRPTGRYLQNPTYINRLGEKNGFREMICDGITIRNEHGNPVAGNLYVLQKRTP